MIFMFYGHVYNNMCKYKVAYSNCVSFGGSCFFGPRFGFCSELGYIYEFTINIASFWKASTLFPRLVIPMEATMASSSSLSSFINYDKFTVSNTFFTLSTVVS